LSVGADQVRLICVVLAAVAVSPVGTVGAVVSAPALVVAEATPESPLRSPEESTARTR